MQLAIFAQKRLYIGARKTELLVAAGGLSSSASCVCVTWKLQVKSMERRASVSTATAVEETTDK